MDEIDLKAKYLPGKKAQFDSIIANAKSFMHPTRNVRVYQDIDYNGSETTEVKDERKETISGEQEEMSRPPKKAKSAPKKKGVITEIDASEEEKLISNGIKNKTRIIR